jgi:hypothetical protein
MKEVVRNRRQLVFVAACGTASCAIVANLGDRTLGDTDAGADGAAAHDGATGDDVTGTDGTSIDAPAADAPAPDSAVADDRIDPLEIGRRWSYKLIPNDGGGTACDATAGAIVGPGAPIDGSATLRYQPLCTPFLVDVIVDGDRVTAYSFDGRFNGPQVIVDSPVEEGHTWTGGAQFVWHDAGTLVVPAGTFSDCWAREIVGSPATRTIYCRGVGLTRTDDPTYTAVLTSKNF